MKLNNSRSMAPNSTSTLITNPLSRRWPLSCSSFKSISVPSFLRGVFDRDEEVVTGSSCPARFHGCISSPMEKRVSTEVESNAEAGVVEEW